MGLNVIWKEKVQKICKPSRLNNMLLADESLKNKDKIKEFLQLNKNVNTAYQNI